MAATAVAYVAIQGPPVHSASVFWGTTLVPQASTRIWASSHFGQVANYLVLIAVRALADPHFTAPQAMRLVSYAMGLLYLTALVLFSRGLAPHRRIPLFLLGALSPVTVFLHGDESLGVYPAPFLLLAVALYGLRNSHALRERATVAAVLAGIGAAFHGMGLIFLPGVLALRLAADRVRSLRDAAQSILSGAASFFGPTGALFIFYVVAFKTVVIFPGDAGGGGQLQEFILPFQSIPAHGPGNEFREYSFFSGLHLVDVLTTLAMGVPALAAVFVVSLARPHMTWRMIRSRWPEWTLAAMGVVLVAVIYPGVGVIASQYVLVPALSLLQVLSLAFVLEIDERPWRRSFWPLLALTMAATAFDWMKEAQGAL